MSLKKLPLRRCIACYKPFPKKDLKRVVCTKAGQIRLDPTGKESGRGAYICSLPCFYEAIKKKRFAGALKSDLTGDVVATLTNDINELFSEGA